METYRHAYIEAPWLLACFCVAFLILGPSSAYGLSLYDYKVIAQTGTSLQGTNPIIALGRGPSINDNGTIAFVAKDEPGTHGRVLLVSDGNVTNNYQIVPTERIGGNVQINNHDRVVFWQRIEAGTDATDTFVNRLEKPLPAPTIARGKINNLPDPYINPKFDEVYSRFTLNNKDLVVFTGLLDPAYGGGTVIASSSTGLSDSYQMTPSLTGSPIFYPMASDNDRVVIRDGNSSVHALIVFTEPTLDPSQAIVVATNVDYNAVGNKPGISDDGRVAVFMGDSKTEGPGIYMLTIGNQSQPISINKVADIPVSSNLDYRVGVNHSQNRQPFEYLVAYIVADATGERTLNTVRVDLTNPFTPIIAAPNPVAETGNTLQNLTSLGVVQDIQIYDPVNDSGQLVFWVQTNAAEAIIHAFCADGDGDAICDNWETNGMRDVNDNMLLDLPAMGADPSVKDIFIEVDYMESPDGHTHKPSNIAMNFVVNAFFNSPVDAPQVPCPPGDPTGCSGIRLHIDYGPASVMDPSAVGPVQGAVWGVLSESTRLVHTINFGENHAGSICNDDNEVKELISIKRGSTNGIPNFRPERIPVFHYVVFAHNRCSGNGGGFTLPAPPGGAQIRDSVLTLGRSPATNAVGSILDQAGTFMHEIGHQLGLYHGGEKLDQLNQNPRFKGINWKPNYLSVMNYSFQRSGLVINSTHPRHPGPTFANVLNGYFDYSRFGSSEIAVLDESNLSESDGLQLTPANPSLAGYGTYYYCDEGVQSQVDNITQDIDWNCNGIWPESGIIDDINIGLDKTKDSSGVGHLVLQSHNDWENLIFFGNAVGAAGFGSQPPFASIDEPNIDDRAFATSIYNVHILNPMRLVLQRGDTGTYQFIIENTGSTSDAYSLQASSSMGWADVSAIPSSVTLAPAETVTIYINITLPTVYNLNDSDELTLMVSSQSNPLLINSATVITTVDSDGDGLSDADENDLNINPNLVDTDGDGLTDGPGGIVPLSAYPNGIDTDSDGYVDGEMDFGNDPTINDYADGDIVPDSLLNAADMLVATRVAIGNLPITPQALGHIDMNADGAINAGDLYLLTQKVLTAP